MRMADEATFGDQGFLALDRDEGSAQAVSRRRDQFHVVLLKCHPFIKPPEWKIGGIDLSPRVVPDMCTYG